MKQPLSRAILCAAAIGLLLSGGYLAIKRLWPHVDDRVYVIGWQNSPPFQQKAADGSPAGVAIDLVRDAARRRGIRLRWVWYPDGPDAALRSRTVDLWPLITIAPERKGVIHISKPYLQHDHDLLVRASSPWSKIEDLRAATVSHEGMPIGWRMLNSLLPDAHMVPVASPEAAIENVCVGRTDAAFLNEFTAGVALLRGAACASQPLRVIPALALRTKLGVGSTLEASSVADEIREGIDASILEGDLAKILNSGQYLTLRNMQYFTAMLDAQRQDKWLRGAILVFVCLLALTALAADRIRRQHNRIAVTDESLRQSERRFRKLLEDVRLVAVMTDLRGAISFWNKYAAALTGWSEEEVIGRPAKDFLDLEVPLLETGAPPNTRAQPFCEGTVLLKNAERRWIQWSSAPLRDSAGHVIGLASLGEDVTELRTLRAEAARLESEEQFRKIADTAPLMIWTAGPDMGCAFVNKAWLNFTGRTLEQELGDGWTANVHPDDLDHTRAVWAAAYEARRGVGLEYRIRRADEEYRWVLRSGVPRFSAKSQFLGYIGACTDITDLKRSWDEDATRQKLETVGRFAGGIAHDFNNLLGGVLAQADLALAELSSGVLPEEELNNIRGVAIRGATIVRQLMIYAGQESAISEPVDLSYLIDDMRDLLKVVVSKNVVLNTELCSDLPAVEANSAQLRQVVMNLVTNASEAIGERDGVIAIRTARSEAAREMLRDKTGGCVELEVRDTGSGMSLETQTKIFDPFFTTKSAGHGLGLAVVQGIVKGLGGAIQLESHPGRGSTFHIFLPSSSEVSEPLRAAEVHPAPEEMHHAPMVLVVEDEEPLRLAAVKMLRLKGFGVVEAADGTEALAAIKAHKSAIALLLLDMTIPGAPSREVLTKARQVRPEVKVIVTSAYGPNKMDESFPGMKIDSFLRKPYELEELVNLVLGIVSEEDLIFPEASGASHNLSEKS